MSLQKRVLAEQAAAAGKPAFVTSCQSFGRTTLDAKEHSSTGIGSV